MDDGNAAEKVELNSNEGITPENCFEGSGGGAMAHD